ncbi:MAG: hypothetical protein ACRDF5_10610 [bacterium]
MPISRRGFLKAALGVTGGVAAASAAGAAANRAAIYRWLASPGVGTAAPGPLPTGVLDTLLAATETLTGLPVELEHYAAFFRWRAEHLPGHRALYEDFVATVDRAAMEAGRRPFAASGETTRRAILGPAFRVRQADGPLDRLWVAMAEREWVRFEEHVVREILLLFSETDAWTRLGYDGWRGRPRGLAAYLLPPPALRR